MCNDKNSHKTPLLTSLLSNVLGSHSLVDGVGVSFNGIPVEFPKKSEVVLCPNFYSLTSCWLPVLYLVPRGNSVIPNEI